jgi:EAL domain-containing protein (putative c-di-GMP-specific phosphodiesterase class I)/CheY-like chemotaxis protein/GGDEF domain-containing protein
MIDLDFTKQLDVLFVEDEEKAREIGKKLFEKFFKKVDVAKDGEEGLEKFKNGHYDLVITDITMPKMNGIELIKKIREIKPNQEIIVLTAHSDKDLILETINLNVGYVLKPINLDTFMQVLKKVINNLKILKEHESYEKELQENLKKKVEEIESLLYYDKTTSLPNINKLKEDISENDEVFIIDISNFKKINAVFGIKVGDDILKDLAYFLKKRHSRVYKLPEAVFCIIKENEQLEKICDEVKDYTYKKIDIEIRFTFKVYSFIAGDILERFNLLNSFLKDKGIKKLCDYFSEEDLEKILNQQKEHQKCINKVIEALENDMFIPYFQPIIDNKTQRIVKYESLIRMKDKNKVISPYFFLKPAKDSGLMNELTKVMFKKSLEVAKKKNIALSLNITQEDLLNDEFFEYILSLDSKLCKNITLEILENIDDFNTNLVDKINEIKKNGFLIAIDDFGSGYSNFQRVIDIDPDFIKIDGSLIKNIENPKFFHTVFAILNFAKSLSADLIAEYVENEQIFKIIKMIGIEYSQGYYFSPPLSEEEL